MTKTKEQLELSKNKILIGDCISLMKDMPGNSVDMVFADPPYNLQLGGELFRPNNSQVSAVSEAWDKFNNFKHYDQFTTSWLREARRVLKPNGCIWVIGSYHNIFRVGKIMQDEGYWLLNDIIWRKSNPMPNFRGMRFTNAHETLIWAAKSEISKYTFNYEALKELNEGLQMRSDWYLSICSGGERLKGKDGKKIHPTQKPESLLNRIIISATNQNDIILDPFFGTGTTGVVAKRLGRNFIGLEREEIYAKEAAKRIKVTKTYDEEALQITQRKREEPRVPFGILLEMGYLKPGENLHSLNGRHTAKIRADGTLIAHDARGSIHQVGAFLEGMPSCNGWTYWQYKRDGQNFPIDLLRQKIRDQVQP